MYMQNVLVGTEQTLNSTQKTLHKTEVKLEDTALILAEHKQVFLNVSICMFDFSCVEIFARL